MFTTLPLREFILQPQFTRVRMHQGMENLGYKDNLGHILWIVLREENLELDNCILVDSLLDKIGTNHSLERLVALGWHHVDPYWSVLL